MLRDLAFINLTMAVIEYINRRNDVLYVLICFTSSASSTQVLNFRYSIPVVKNSLQDCKKRAVHHVQIPTRRHITDFAHGATGLPVWKNDRIFSKDSLRALLNATSVNPPM